MLVWGFVLAGINHLVGGGGMGGWMDGWVKGSGTNSADDFVVGVHLSTEAVGLWVLDLVKVML